MTISSETHPENSFLDKTLDVVRSLDGVDGVSMYEGKIRFQALDAINLLPAVSREIDAMGGRITGLSLHGNSLEDIFISLTGSTLRE